MDVKRISLILLLPCVACTFDAEVSLVKIIGKEPDFTPICTNETSNIIMMLVCKIRTEMSSGEECRLLYRDGCDFVHQCDSRFALKMRNQTVFLHLTGLTPADSGNHSCECSKASGMLILHLNITVNDSVSKDKPEDNDWSPSAQVTNLSALTAAVLLLISLSVILGLIHRRHRACLRSPTSESSVRGSTANDEDNSDEAYTNLQEPSSHIYQTISLGDRQQTEAITASSKVADELDNVGANRNRTIYENLGTKNQLR